SLVPHQQWPAVRRILDEQLPGVTASEVDGVVGKRGRTPLHFRVPGHRAPSSGYAERFSSSVLVGPEALAFTGLEGDALARARAVLDRGGAVLMTTERVSATTPRVSTAAGRGHGLSVTVRATYVDDAPYGVPPMFGIV